MGLNFGVLLGCIFGPLGAQCEPWGSFWALEGRFPRELRGAIFGPPKGLKMLKTSLKDYQNMFFWAFGGAWGDPEIRTTATFPEWKNGVSLHLATILNEKSAWDIVEYEVSTFAKTQEPCILRIKMNCFL